MFVALLAFVFSITVTVQMLPAGEVQHALIATAIHTADVIGDETGTPDTKDDCGLSIQCHHVAAILPDGLSIGAVPDDRRMASVIEDGAFRVVQIPVPPPRSA